MEYYRARVTGGTYFFTVVTHHRRSFLCEPQNIRLLRRSFLQAMGRYPFAIDAIVILPEHLYDIWMLPEGDADYSTRWRLIKTMFSRQYNPVHHGLVKALKDWEYSSFHRYVQERKYDIMGGLLFRARKGLNSWV